MATTELSLGIESGIKNVQSQHIGECAYDSIQMTLFFADGFRSIFANFAEIMLNLANQKTDPAKLTAAKLFGLDPMFEAAVAEYFGIGAENPYLISFVARSVRRFILIKLQDGGWTLQHVLQFFSLDSIETPCLLPFKQERSQGVLLRRPSLNTQAGLTTAESAMKLIDKEVNVNQGQLKTRGTTMDEPNRLWDVILSGITKQDFPGKFRKSEVYEPENFDKLLCIYILSKTDQGAGHANTILRYRNDFYYCDNEVGQAVKLVKPLTPELAIKNDSIVFDLGDVVQVLINGVEHARISAGDFEKSVYKSRAIIFLYALEPVGDLSTDIKPITLPPALEPTTVASASISYTFTKTRSAAGAYWAQPSPLAAKNAALAARFSKTIRADRWALPEARAVVGTETGRRFTRTLRARKAGKN
jgi:hypothetical protein